MVGVIYPISLVCIIGDRPEELNEYPLKNILKNDGI